MFGKLKLSKMDIEKLLKKATEDKNINALSHLKDAAIHLQQYEIASEIKKIIEPLELPQSVVLEKEQKDDYTTTVYSHVVEISGNFIGLINTGKVLCFEKKEIEDILFAMNNKVRQS